MFRITRKNLSYSHFVHCAVFVCIFLSGRMSFAQGNDCATATVLTDLTNYCSANAAYTNVASTPSGFGAATCWTGTALEDVWFSFVCIGTDALISVSGNGSGGTMMRPRIALYTGNCGGTLNQQGSGCNDGTAGSGTSQIYVGGLSQGMTYYLRISTTAANEGTFKLCINNYTPPPSASADCGGAGKLCNMNSVSVGNLSGGGTNNYENDNTCIDDIFPIYESNSVWYTWTCATAGTLTLDIVPANPTHDIDFVIYQLNTTNPCGARTVIRCSAASCLGPGGSTGMNMASTDVSEPLGCPGTSNAFVQYINMTAGTSYAILIMNATASSGFNLNWGGTGTFVGPDANITTAPFTACAGSPVTFNGATSTNYTTLNWNFVNGTGSPTTATGPGPHNVTYSTPGTYTAILNAVGTGCTSTEAVSVTINTPVTPTFTALTPVCQGATISALPTTSINSIPGTWNPTTFSTASAGTFTATFTPAAGQCANTTTISLTVNPSVTPTFNPIAAVCQGAAAPVPPGTSTNSINGTWSPAISTASAGTSCSTFTPTSGTCPTTASICVTINAPTTPAFTALAAVCQGGSAPALSGTSTNSINGTWTPASLSTATAGSVCSTFTPTAGQCATTTSICLTIDAPTTPTFTALSSVCQGETAPALPGTSTNSINGTWAPAALSTAVSGSVCSTFTPTAGQCATTTSICLTIDAPTTPTFTALSSVCQGETAPALPGTSTNSINGTWAPAALSTTASGSVCSTFTPTAGQCATTASICLTVDPLVTPTFAALGSVCQNAAAPTLPGSSNESISGTWMPATLNTSATGSVCSTFTPTAGQCATTATLCLNVTTPTTPVFTALTAVCEGDPSPPLPGTSDNSINGTWSPATLSTTSAGSVCSTFTPSAGQCATTATLCLTVNAPVTPTFTPLTPICEGDPAPVVSGTTVNGFTGTWSPALFPNSPSGVSICGWTPSPGQCVTTGSLSLTIVAPTVPTFTTPAAVCQGDVAPALPGTSNNGITGTWNPTTFDTSVPGSSICPFAPTAGQCATTATLTLIVNAPVTPTFTPLSPVCEGAAAPSLPGTSDNGIPGTWSPATLNTTASGTICSTFTPAAGECATTAPLCLTVTTGADPTFDPVPNICQGATAPPLELPSNEGATGTWSPTTINTTSAGTFTFTFTPDPGQCTNTTTITVTIDPLITTTFTPLTDVCQGDPAPTLPTSSTNSPAITGTWDAAASTATPGTITYTFTPDPGQCATTATLSLTVNAADVPTFTAPGNECIAGPAPTLPASSNEGITGTWDAAPTTVAAGTFTFTFTPDAGQCATTATITFTVDPNPTISVPSLSTCSDVPVILTASGAVDYVWSPTTGLNPPSGIGSSVEATLSADQTYTITGTDANGCVGTTTATVTIASGLTIGVNPSAPTVCAGECVTLSATGGTNYTWTGAGVTPNNTATVTACPATTTTYTVDGETSGCTGSTTVTVTVGSPVIPTFNALGPICSGSTAPVLPTSSTNSPPITGNWTPAVSNTASGTYTFTPAPTECATTASMSITVNTPPSLSGVTELCNGTNTAYTIQVTLSGGNVASYSVNENAPGSIGGSFAGNVWTSNPIPSGTAYDFDFDDASGCGPVSVTGMKNCNCVTSAGTMSGPALTLCQGDAANATHNGNETLDGNDVLSFVLHSGSGTSLGTVYATSTTPSFNYTGALTFGTTYYISAVAGDNNGSGGVVTTDPCLSVAPGTPVVWNATPTISVSNNGPVCEGSTIILSASPTPAPTTTYDWDGPNGFDDNIQNPTIPSSTSTDAGTYTLVITNNGCASTPATTTLVVNAQTIPTFSALTPVCVGAPAPGLPGTSNETISGSWNGAPSSASAGTQNFTFTPSPGQCATTASLSFTVNPLPVADAGPDQDVCPGIPVTLCGSGGATSNWTGGITDCAAFTPGTTQTYTLTVTDANGCQDTDAVTVTVYSVPVITASANPTTACLGEAILFNGGGGIAPYFWDNGVTNNSPFTPTTAGTVTYNVGAQDINGCVGTASVSVTIYALPLVNGGPDQSACPGDAISLAGSGAVSYTWDGAVDNVPFVPSANYTYTVTGTDANGCMNTDQVVVTLAVPPVADFSVNQSEATVSEPLFIFNNQSTGAATYFWDFGDEQTSAAVDPSHTYAPTPATYSIWLYVTSAEGCEDSTRQTIVVKDELVFWIPNTFTPNGDERNNTFQPVFSSGFDPYNFTMMIYNRWGEVIFETHNAMIGWDGTYKGNIVEEGIYTWWIKVKEPQMDKKSEFTGYINVMR